MEAESRSIVRFVFDISTSPHYDVYMRTTITIDDDLFEAAKSLAAQKNVPLGKAVSELMRRGAQYRGHAKRRKSGFHVFEVPANARPVTLETVKRAEEES